MMVDKVGGGCRPALVVFLLTWEFGGHFSPASYGRGS